MTKTIAGIQQIGIGVSNLYEARDWYKKYFGYDVVIFDEAAEAGLMVQYTDDKVQKRHAILSYNMKGGGGFEVWQHTGKTPLKPKFEIQLGDLGIFIAKQKTKDINKAFNEMKSNGVIILGEIVQAPNEVPHFFIRDPFGNIFQIVENDYLLFDTPAPTGGVLGAIIGVSDIDASLKVYSDILNYSEVVYDKTDVFSDFLAIPGGGLKTRRILLRSSEKEKGGFSPLFGPTELELVQVLDAPVRKIYENRIWGDPGFIHLCFDVYNIASLRNECSEKNFPFTVDSENSFDMGEAAGQFAYISDPDGTPIEFVETHKLPIIKAIGWVINLQKRDPRKPLSKFILRLMSFKRVK